MYLYRAYEEFLLNNANVVSENVTNNSRYLNDQYYKYVKSTESYWMSDFKFLDSFYSTRYANFLDQNNDPVGKIEQVLSLLLKLINIEGKLLKRGEALSPFEIDYDRVLKPFLKKQLEIQKENSKEGSTRYSDRFGYFGNKYFDPDFRQFDKRLELSQPTSYSVKEANDFYLAVAFSDSQSVLNKKELKKIYRLDTYVSTKGQFETPVYQNYRENVIHQNIRSNKSVIASVVFASPVVYDLTVNLLSAKIHNPKGLDTFQASYIEHIFIIKKEMYGYLGPRFYRKEYYLSGKKHQIFVNFISLNDLCLLYSTLDNLKTIKGMNRKDPKFNPEEVIYVFDVEI